MPAVPAVPLLDEDEQLQMLLNELPQPPTVEPQTCAELDLFDDTKVKQTRRPTMTDCAGLRHATLWKACNTGFEARPGWRNTNK